MRWTQGLRLGTLLTVALLLAGSLAGIFFTGPIVVNVPPIDVGVVVSPDRLQQSVEKLCGDLSPRNHRYPGRLNRVALWIAARFEESGHTATFQDYAIRKRSYRNVVLEWPGTNPDAGAIVIGAHYDAYEDSPGADDNASGVAALIELARTRPARSYERTHYLVAFSTGEPPYFGSPEMGSHVFARSLVERGVDVELMIAVESIGYYVTKRHSQGFPLRGLGFLFPDRADFVAVIGDAGSGKAIRKVKRGMMATRAIEVRSFRAPVSSAPIDLSDHWSFRDLSLPAVQVTDTSFMRYPHYHRREDTPDRLDYDRMAAVVRGLHGVLWEGE